MPKHVLKVADILASLLLPTIVSWFSLYSKKSKKFWELVKAMIYTIASGHSIKDWMFTINKIKANCLNDIRKLKNRQKM